MSYYFINIKNIGKDDILSVTNFFQYLIGNNVEIINNEIYSVIFKQDNIDDILEALESMTNDFFNIVIYISKSYIKKEDCLLDLDIIKDKMINQDLFNKFIYNEKEFIKELLMQNKKEDLDNLVFSKYKNDVQTKEVIKKYIENNMNTKKTAEVLYMHRNTLINKLDRFKTVTSYDPKIFIDAFIIYNLL